MAPFPYSGFVLSSSHVSHASASAALPRHISSLGASDEQTAGRSGRPKIAQRPSAVNWTQRTPAGFPSGMPGIGDEIDGAMQQAAQPGRQFMRSTPRVVEYV